MLDFVHQHLDDGADPALAVLQFLDAYSEIFVGGNHLAQSDEGPHDGDIHLYSPFAMQHGGQHGYAEFSKGKGRGPSAATACFCSCSLQ